MTVDPRESFAAHESDAVRRAAGARADELSAMRVRGAIRGARRRRVGLVAAATVAGAVVVGAGALALGSERTDPVSTPSPSPTASASVTPSASASPTPSVTESSPAGPTSAAEAIEVASAGWAFVLGAAEASGSAAVRYDTWLVSADGERFFTGAWDASGDMTLLAFDAVNGRAVLGGYPDDPSLGSPATILDLRSMTTTTVAGPEGTTPWEALATSDGRLLISFGVGGGIRSTVEIDGDSRTSLGEFALGWGPSKPYLSYSAFSSADGILDSDSGETIEFTEPDEGYCRVYVWTGASTFIEACGAEYDPDQFFVRDLDAGTRVATTLDWPLFGAQCVLDDGSIWGYEYASVSDHYEPYDPRVPVADSGERVTVAASSGGDFSWVSILGCGGTSMAVSAGMGDAADGMYLVDVSTGLTTELTGPLAGTDRQPEAVQVAVAP